MIFSVVLPTYNRKLSLLQCLENLARQTLPPDDFEVIVVVDGSTDGTSEAIRTLQFPFHLQVIDQENRGPSSARNHGAANARGEYLAFIEDDIVPEIDWLERAAALLRKDPPIDVLEGRTISASDRRNIRQFDVSGIPSFIPCNLFIRRSLFSGTSGYDPEFYDHKTHLYFREDADLGFRVMDAGARVVIANDVVVSHPFQFTGIRQVFRHANRYLFDPLLYRKHPIRYRSMIERKAILGIRLRRVHHVVALVYVIALACLAYSLVRSHGSEIVGEGFVLLLCVLFFKYKYQGSSGFRLARLGDVPAFAGVPIVYLRSLLAGCFRFRSFGTLIP